MHFLQRSAALSVKIGKRPDQKREYPTLRCNSPEQTPIEVLAPTCSRLRAACALVDMILGLGLQDCLPGCSLNSATPEQPSLLIPNHGSLAKARRGVEPFLPNAECV